MSSTGIKESYIDYAIFYNNTTCLSDINCSGLSVYNNLIAASNITNLSSLTVSGNTILNNFTTINAPLYINTYQSTTISALNVNSSTVGIMVNLIQNTPWNVGINYALNVTGYSNFGGVQINGQDTNNIYKSVGDLTIASPSINSIILKTNSGFWETMRINPYGITMNTSLYVTGPAIFNNDVSILGTLTCNTMDIITTEIIIGDTTLDSKLFVSGSSMFQNAATCLSSLNVIGATTHSGATTAISTLNVSGVTTLNNATTCIGKLSIAGNVNQNINDNTALIMDAGGNGRLGFLKQAGYQPKISTISGSSIIFTSLTGGNLTQSITNTTTFQDLMALSSNGTLSVSGNANILSGFNVSGNTTLNNLVTCVSSLNISGNATFNNLVTCISSFNVSGNAIINNILTCGSSLNVSGNTTLNNLVTCISSLNVSGNTTFNNATTCISSLNISGVSTFNNQVTCLSSLNVSGNIFGLNIPKKSEFSVILTGTFTIGSSLYSRYDIDLTQYTKYITVSNAAGSTTTRRFKFMSCLATGAHNAGLYSLNYDIDYSFLSYTGLGNLPSYNGLNAVALGYPYPNYNLNKVTPNGVFIWKNSFNYLTIYGIQGYNFSSYEFQVIIIDYL